MLGRVGTGSVAPGVKGRGVNTTAHGLLVREPWKVMLRRIRLIRRSKVWLLSNAPIALVVYFIARLV
jgi:hypothetical protein